MLGHTTVATFSGDNDTAGYNALGAYDGQHPVSVRAYDHKRRSPLGHRREHELARLDTWRRKSSKLYLDVSTR